MRISLLTRPVPSSGEQLPIVGLGSSATFSQVAKAADVSAIGEVHRRHGYLLDPHSAVAWLALDEVLATDRDAQGVFELAQAHVRHADVVDEAGPPQPVERPHARGERDARVGRVELIEE